MQLILHKKANLMTDTFKKQLEEIITEHEPAANVRLSSVQISDLKTRCIAAIARSEGHNSLYFRQVDEINKGSLFRPRDLASLIGIAKALLSDIQNDYLSSFEETVHGDMFGDFLEMADQLIENKNKDAAAVLAGSTLEAHIRQLCDKYRVTTISGEKPKKTDTLNAILVKAGAYTKLDQKNVTAWLGLRNQAVHGNYSEYTMGEVKIFIAGIRDFITRTPA